MATFTAGAQGVNFDQIDIGILALGQVTAAGPTSFVVSTGLEQDQFFGAGFAYGGNGFPVTGVIATLVDSLAGQLDFRLDGLNLAVSDLNTWVAMDASEAAKAVLFAGDDLINGSDANDLLRGYAGGDTINGNGAADTIDGGDGNNIIHGGNGDDVIVVTGGSNYLRGDDGDDSILGAAAFDDINGNKGNDTLDGGPGGDDWLVGGQGDDMIIAEHGSNLVYGNLGNDTLQAGDGLDILRGGQGDDSIIGGAGNDFISGDRGNDTESGGPGADIFHGSQDAGVDKVLDFGLAQGDRVMLDPGTTYRLEQVGSDTVIDMGGGNQMILVGVQLATLTPGWIFGA
jgi:Ca2+-binding RTX toxin-like protein